MIRRTPVMRGFAAAAVSVALAGCSLDFLAWPESAVIQWPEEEPEPRWESLLPLPVAPATASADPNDPAQDFRLAMARFGFVLLASGGLAGLVAWQAKTQREKDPRNAEIWREDIGWPIAAFGLSIGIPIYIVSTVLAEQGLEEAERKKLAPSP